MLKGGSALEMIYGVSNRSSIDLNFSMSGTFAADELAEEQRLAAGSASVFERLVLDADAVVGRVLALAYRDGLLPASG